MKTTDFAKHLTSFLSHYLPAECGVSLNTIKTYSYTFTLLIKYYSDVENIAPEHISLDSLTYQHIIDFLDWLEKDRKCSIATRNARLGCLHSFFNYLQYRNVQGIAQWQKLRSIKSKRTPTPEMAYLDISGTQQLLKQPDLHTKKGRRDFTLIGLMYDSACRVQEIIDLTPSCFRFDTTTTLVINGKGNKTRVVPLDSNQVHNLRQYMNENDLLDPINAQRPLFQNPQGEKLSRMAVLNIIKKYAHMAKMQKPELIPENIGCHSLRHSKAMHMLEAGVNLVWIRDFLGHSSTTTTEIYARASSKMKEEALSKLDPGIVKKGKSSWQKNKELLSYLKSLQTKY